MATFQSNHHFWFILLIVAALSSFTVVIAADDSSKSEEQADVTTAEESSSQEDSKEKRSQEEIMFGNQQNKPNGLVDDLMGMSENADENSNGSQVQDSKSDEGVEEEKRTANQDESPNDVMMAAENWYSTLPAASPSALQYFSNSQALKTLPPEVLASGLYDQEDLYRRKRQLLEHPLPLRKRSLRSSLGQMIQKRGIRLPRRSMRLKRQVDVEDLLNLFGNERYYNDEAQVTPHSFSGRARTVSKRHVPARLSGYQETPEYRYPYVFQHRDDGILSAANEANEGNMDNDAIDDLMLLPPGSQYIDTFQDLDHLPDHLPYRTREEENEGIQKWLNRHTVPSVFRVSRRSSPFFYPIDYRYIPGYKKRSGGNGPSGRFSDEEAEGDFGKWGHVVQVPEAYASPEDIARLYGLANLLSEGDDVRMRRST